MTTLTNGEQDYNKCLLEIAASGDRRAFAAIYGYFAPRVKGFLMRGGATPEEAEDLAQDTMVKVLNKAGQFDPQKASAATWIFTIARNSRIDAIRRATKPALDASEPMLVPEESPRADELCELSERDMRIRKAFEGLPTDQREVMRLHFFEDEPHSTIAERLDLPLGTVKSRLRLAFDKVRRELGDLDE